MFSDKLTTLLQSFSKYELNRFGKFLRSPWFNEQDDVVRLYELLRLLLRKNEDALRVLDKKSVWKSLYDKKPYDDAQLRRLASDLTQLGLQFLSEEKRRENPLRELLDQQDALDRPELRKHLGSLEKQAMKILEQEKTPDVAHYLQSYQLHWQIFNRATKVVDTSNYLEKLAPADRALDNFYLLQKLKFYTAWLIFSGMRAGAHEVSLPEGFLQMTESEHYRDNPLIATYRQVLHCLVDPEQETHYRQLRTLLNTHAAQIGKSDLRECYLIAQNYCAFKINQGRTEYYQENFELYKSIIEQEILLENGQLQEGIFKNIVTTGLRVGEYEWVEKFIQEYAEFLPQSIRENARSFNLANLYSRRREHARVIELLRNVEYSDVVYALGSKVLLVYTYYETNEMLVLDSLLDSFRIYLRRNKLISKNLKTEYGNFLSFVKKLSSLLPRQQTEIEQVRQRIEKCKSVTSKKWLLEKADELQKIKK